MPFITTSDGTELYYTEQGSGQPVIFSHGWPLSSDAWQVELKVFADAGYRAIAHDRRGHGRSSKTYQGNDMDTYARDLAELVEALDVPILIAHGDDDQIVPVGAAALKTAEIVKHGTLKLYPGAPHGIYGDFQVTLDADILDFIAK